jgi:hypothetical protein
MIVNGITDAGFTPVTVVLTVTSDEELRALRYLGRYARSAATVIASNDRRGWLAEEGDFPQSTAIRLLQTLAFAAVSEKDAQP